MSGHDIINIFHDFKVKLNEATNHTVHVSNHGALSVLSALSTLSEALKGGFIMTYIYIYIAKQYNIMLELSS